MDDVALVEKARELRSLEESSTLTGKAQTVENVERCRWYYREQEIEKYVGLYTTQIRQDHFL